MCMYVVCMLCVVCGGGHCDGEHVDVLQNVLLVLVKWILRCD